MVFLSFLNYKKNHYYNFYFYFFFVYLNHFLKYYFLMIKIHKFSFDLFLAKKDYSIFIMFLKTIMYFLNFIINLNLKILIICLMFFNFKFTLIYTCFKYLKTINLK